MLIKFAGNIARKIKILLILYSDITEEFIILYFCIIKTAINCNFERYMTIINLKVHFRVIIC